LKKQSELCFAEGPSGGGESERIKGRLRAILYREDNEMPLGIRRQFTNTLLMHRSENEWIDLEKTVNRELIHWDEVAAAKWRSRQAKAYLKKHGRWPSWHKPNIDPAQEVSSCRGVSGDQTEIGSAGTAPTDADPAPGNGLQGNVVENHQRIGNQ
jgi:hypothetical protein